MKKLNIKETGTTAAGLVAGSILANVLYNKLPASISNPKMRAAIPLLGGIVLSMQKSGMIKNVGYGMIANGGAKVAGTFVPQIAGVCGLGDEIYGMGDDLMNGLAGDGMDGLGDDMAGLGDSVINGMSDDMAGFGSVLNGFYGAGDGSDN